MSDEDEKDERYDGWSNPAAGLGGIRDKSVGLGFTRRPRLPRDTIEPLYEQNPIAARLVDKIADDAMRKGWELADVEVEDGSPSFDPDAVKKRLDDLKLKAAVVKLIQWGRLYGGAAMTLPTLEKQPDKLEQPLRLCNVGNLTKPQVLAAHNVRPGDTDSDFISPTFAESLNYHIEGIGSKSVKVHRSRLITFEPVTLPFDTQLRNAGHESRWGPSVLERVFDDLGRDGASRSHAVAMMYIASILYLKIKGYRADYKGKEGKEKLREMMQGVARDLKSLGVLGLDGEDEVGAVSLSLSGAYDLIDRMRDALAAATPMPKEILFNESPAGLNAGELSGPQELWFGVVAAFQEEALTPIINRFLEVLFAAMGLKVKSWRIEWNELWVKSDKAASDLSKSNSESDEKYVNMGAATAEEVRKHRFVDGKIGPLEVPAPPEVEPLDLSGEVAAYKQALSFAPAAAAVPAPPSAEPPPQDLMSPQEAAAQYGVHTRTITRQIQVGALKYWGLGGHKRVSVAAVAALARQHEQQPEAPPVVAA